MFYYLNLNFFFYLGWKFDSFLTKTLNYATVDPNTEFTGGGLQTFESLGLPYAYSFSIMYDTGWKILSLSWQWWKLHTNVDQIADKSSIKWSFFQM